MSRMYLMSGMSGSGKTTFAKQFAAKNNLLYLCPDDFYAVFNGDETIHEHEFEVWIALFQAIHAAESGGRDCIVDTNSPTMVDRVQMINWFPDFDEHHLIYVYAPLELCIQNNAGRKRRVPDDVMEAIYNSIEVPTPNEDERWTSIQYVQNRNNSGFIVERTMGSHY